MEDKRLEPSRPEVSRRFAPLFARSTLQRNPDATRPSGNGQRGAQPMADTRDGAPADVCWSGRLAMDSTE